MFERIHANPAAGLLRQNHEPTTRTGGLEYLWNDKATTGSANANESLPRRPRLLKGRRRK